MRLGAAFACLLALTLVMAAVGNSGLDRSIAGAKAIGERAHQLKLAGEWRSLTNVNLTRTLAIAKSGGQSTLMGYFQPIMNETTRQIGEIQKEIADTNHSEKGIALVAEIGRIRQQYLDVRKEVFELFSQNEAVRAEALLTSAMIPVSDAYLAALGAFSDYQASWVDDEANGVEHIARMGQRTLIACLSAALLMGALLGWLITRSITGPIDEAVAISRSIADGDLTRVVSTARRDEFGTLMAALKAMQKNLHGIVGSVRESTQSISQASNEIAQGNLNLSARTEQAAASLARTASSTDEVLKTVRRAVESATRADRLASSAAQSARDSGAIVAQVVASMDDISEASRKIGDIIGVIDGVAFQTNILALNAAVEAARAGEQGRGFAVVAAEVRLLAKRSATAAHEIKALIVDSIDKVDSGARLVSDAGIAMTELVESIEGVGKVVAEISAATEEQSGRIGEISQAVGRVDEMTGQNAVLVDESAAATEQLKERAHGLDRLVATFTLAR